MTQKKEIIICINNLKVGGAEKLIIDQINNWPLNYKINLVLLDNRNELLHLIKRTDFEYFIINKNNILKILIELRKIIKQKNVIGVFSHLERPNKLCSILKIFTKFNLFTVVHNINIYDGSSYLKLESVKYIYKIFPNKIIAISPSVKTYLTKALRISSHKVVQINNGIDLKKLEPYYIKRINQLKKPIVFCTLGRLEPVKGLDFLIDFLSNNSYSNYRLKIIGDGSIKDYLEQKTKECNLTDRVEFIGKVDNPYNHLLDVQFIIFPSIREGLPIALIESLSMGIPAIVTNVGFLPDIVNHEINGFVFDLGNNDQLKKIFDKILLMKSKEYQKLSLNAVNSAQKYNIKTCNNEYLKLLEN